VKEMQVKLEIPDLKNIQINPEDSALVIVDMENEFLHPNGKMYMGDRGLRAIKQTAILLEKFRKSNSKIIYIHSIRSADAVMFKVYNQAHRLLENTWNTEIVKELKPLPQETIVQKRSNDCFNNTTMESELCRLGLKPGRSQIVVTGVATSGCVDCAVVGFSVRDYYVYVPIDATATGTEENEMRGYNHFFGVGYNHNVTATKTDLISVKKQSSQAMAN